MDRSALSRSEKRDAAEAEGNAEDLPPADVLAEEDGADDEEQHGYGGVGDDGADAGAPSMAVKAEETAFQADDREAEKVVAPVHPAGLRRERRAFRHREEQRQRGDGCDRVGDHERGEWVHVLGGAPGRKLVGYVGAHD